jgi:hypothetical protein
MILQFCSVVEICRTLANLPYALVKVFTLQLWNVEFWTAQVAALIVLFPAIFLLISVTERG